MDKVCSLDFAGKIEFDSDIISACGKKLFSKGDKITPEILLSLYFKEIFVQEQSKVADEAEPIIDNLEAQLIEDNVDFIAADNSDKISEEVIEENLHLNLMFDEDHANRIMQLSYNLGTLLDMQEEKLEELKTAAYYYHIGETKCTENDLSKPDFEKIRAEAGYNLLLLEMNKPEQIAEVAKMYLCPYNCVEFELTSKDFSNVPHYHIVSIVDYYDNLINKKSVSKETALMKMLQLGGNKFNIFVLHKFIQQMKDSNE